MKICLLLILLSATPALAQKKLKMDVDKSTGDTTYKTSEVKIYVKPGAPNSGPEMLKSTVYKTKHTIMIAFFIQTGRTSVMTISSNSSAEIKLANGEIVFLPCIMNNESRRSSTAYGCFISGYYRVSAGDRERIMASTIESIRITASSGPMDYALKGKFKETIGEQLQLITINM